MAIWKWHKCKITRDDAQLRAITDMKPTTHNNITIVMSKIALTNTVSGKLFNLVKLGTQLDLQFHENVAYLNDDNIEVI